MDGEVPQPVRADGERAPRAAGELNTVEAILAAVLLTGISLIAQ